MDIQKNQTGEFTRTRQGTVGANTEAEIEMLSDQFFEAFQAADIEKIMAFYADEVIAYDMMPPLEFKGKAAYRKAWETGLSQMGKIEKLERADTKIFADGDLAVLHCLTHFVCTMKDGKKMDSWNRYTGAMRRMNGKWLIVHEQISVPIDMKGEKAIWDLKPETGLKH